MTDIRSLQPEELQSLLRDLGEPAYRARQIFSWLHEKTVQSYEEMTDLPKALRERLEEAFPLQNLTTVQTLTSAQDGTEKYLFALSDGNVIESVKMIYEHGVSVCVSTQVGCRMGCRFCASTLDGLVRALTAGEMLEQVYQIRRASGMRVSHVVLMGSGEPLENLDQVLRFIHLLTAKEGQDLSGRNITLSTCGLVPEILRLAEEKLPITLAISLHAPTDSKRQRLMPIARRYPLEELMDACRTYFEKTGRRITFEYALIRGENDSEEDVAALTRLLHGFPCHVNLIPVNPIAERAYVRSAENAVAAFYKKLEKNGINGTIRREMGADIQGACGQLRKRYIDQDRESKA